MTASQDIDQFDEGGSRIIRSRSACFCQAFRRLIWIDLNDREYLSGCCSVKKRRQLSFSSRIGYAVRNSRVRVSKDNVVGLHNTRLVLQICLWDHWRWMQ